MSMSTPPSATMDVDGSPIPHRAGRGKHALSVTTPSAGTLVGTAMLSPNSDAKRHRTGEYTPGGSLLTAAQWSTDIPMSPATALLATGMAGVGFGPSASPSRDALLPPTHPHTYPASPLLGSGTTVPGGTLSSSTSASVGTAPASLASPAQSAASSSASSPSSFSLGGTASTSSAASAIAIGPASPISLSPVAESQSLAGRRTSPPTGTQSPAPAPSPDDDDDDGKKKGVDNRQGASCHQCKTTKDEQHLLFCTTKAGGSRKRRCRKKYCDSCLQRTYHVHMSQLQAIANGSTWQCPSCVGKCTCAGCTRKVVGRGSGALPAQAGLASVGSLAIPPALLELGTAAAATTTPPKRKQPPTAAAVAVAATPPIAQPATNAHAHTNNHAVVLPTVAATAAPVAPTAAATVLPPPAFLTGRAVSAPNFGSSADARRSAPHAAAVPPALDAVADAALASQVSPPNMDAIASLLLELSTTSSVSSASAPSSEPAPEGVSVFATATATTPTPTPSVEDDRAHFLAAQRHAVDHARLLALPPRGSPIPLAPFTFATSSISAPPPRPAPPSLFPESSVGLAKRFTTPTSLLASSSSLAARFGASSTVAHHHLPLTKFYLPPPSAYPPRTASEHAPITNAQRTYPPLPQPQQF